LVHSTDSPRAASGRREEEKRYESPGSRLHGLESNRPSASLSLRARKSWGGARVRGGRAEKEAKKSPKAGREVSRPGTRRSWRERGGS